MNLTLPSANAKFAPPGWLLLALTKLEPSGAHPRQPPKRQLCQGYCLELGGTTVLNRVQPRSPWAQICPVYCLSPVVSPKSVPLVQNTLQDWRAWLTAVWFIFASYNVS